MHPYLFSLTRIVCFGALGIGSYKLVQYLARLLFPVFLQEEREGDEVEVESRFLYASGLYFLLVAALVIGAMLGLVYIGCVLWQVPFTTKWLVKGFTKRWVLSIDRYNTIGVVQAGEMLLFVVAGLLASLAVRFTALAALFDLFMTDGGLRVILSRMFHYSILTLSVVLGLQYIGLGTYVWQVVLVFSFAFSMGIKDVILDVFSGIWLLLERSIEPTHFIEVDGLVGSVLDIGVRKTLMSTQKGVVALPNRVLMSKNIINWSKKNSRSGVVSFNIIVKHSALRSAQVKEIAAGVFSKELRVYNAPQSEIVVDTFHHLGVQYTVQIAIKRKYLKDYMAVVNDCKAQLYEALVPETNS